MAPWHRAWAVNRLANRIANSIERASAPNRAARGIQVNLDDLEETAWDASIMPEPKTPSLVDSPRSSLFPNMFWRYPESTSVVPTHSGSGHKVLSGRGARKDPWLSVGLTRLRDMWNGGLGNSFKWLL